MGLRRGIAHACRSLRLSPDKVSHEVTIGPERPAQREPGVYSGTAVSRTRLSGRAADARLEDGLLAQFNLFAGVQAGIKIDGALNWAPPKELAILRAAPISNNASEKTAAPEAASHGWLALARLSVSLTAAAGVGFFSFALARLVCTKAESSTDCRPRRRRLFCIRSGL